MKRLLVLGSCLAILAPGLSADAPASPAAREHWVTPQAHEVIARVKTAYASIESWTAITDREDRTYHAGAVEVSIIHRTERYLKGAGLTGQYATVSSRNGVPIEVIVQNADTHLRVFRGPEGLKATISDPDVYNPPMTPAIFQTEVASANYVRWAGKENVAGQDCDVLELTTIRTKPAAKPDAPKEPPTVDIIHYYVDAAGFIQRQTYAGGDLAGGQTYAIELRYTSDTKSKLTDADFSRAVFDREATAVLRGEPMPEIQPELFMRGHRLPEMSVIAWADNKPFRISDLRGKVVVIETWASWCGFCKAAFPFYEKTRKALVDQDVVFVAISFDDKLADYEKWMNQHGGEYGFRFGRIDAASPKKALKEFRGSLPAFYVLGKDGLIISSYLGYGAHVGDPRLLAALRQAGIKI